MPFRWSLLVAPLVPAFLGTLVSDGMFHHANAVWFPQLVKACQLPRFGPRIAWETACKLDGLFRPLCNDAIGRAFFVLVCLFVAPTMLWFFLQGAKSGRSLLLAPWLPTAVLSLGQLKGVGCVSPIVFPSVYALVKILEPAKQGLPAPPSQNYVAVTFGLHLVVLATAFATAFLPITHDWWPTANWTFQFAPLILLPLTFWPPSKPVKDEIPDATRLFQRLRPVVAVSYWLAVGLFAHGYLVQGVRFNEASTMIAWDTLGCFVAWLGVWLVDAAAGDAKGSKPLAWAKQALLEGPPSAMCSYYQHKEAQGAKRARALKKGR